MKTMLNRFICFIRRHEVTKYIWIYWTVVDRPESLLEDHPDTYYCKQCKKYL